MKSFRIRPATNADATTISELIAKISHYFTIDPKGRGAEDFLKTITPIAIAAYIRAENFAYFVGEIDGVIVAAAAIRDAKHVYHLFVHPDHHGQGYARQLWQTLQDAARVLGNTRQFTVNSSIFAEPVYTSWGFTPEGTQQEMHGLRFQTMRLGFTS